MFAAISQGGTPGNGVHISEYRPNGNTSGVVTGSGGHGGGGGSDGIDPDIELPDISTVPVIEFGAVEEDSTVDKVLTVNNLGTAALIINSISTDNPAFTVAPAAGVSLPAIVEPGQSVNLVVSLTHTSGSGSTHIA